MHTTGTGELPGLAQWADNRTQFVISTLGMSDELQTHASSGAFVETEIAACSSALNSGCVIPWTTG